MTRQASNADCVAQPAAKQNDTKVDKAPRRSSNHLTTKQIQASSLSHTERGYAKNRNPDSHSFQGMLRQAHLKKGGPFRKHPIQPCKPHDFHTNAVTCPAKLCSNSCSSIGHSSPDHDLLRAWQGYFKQPYSHVAPRQSGPF